MNRLGGRLADFSDQGLLKGVGNVTNNQTYKDTYLSDKLVQSTGNGTIKTSDGQSIAWISSTVGRPVDGRWVYYGIMLFNNTQSKSLSFLNNSVGLSRGCSWQRDRSHLASEIVMHFIDSTTDKDAHKQWN